jgi:hypothetical protein
LRRIESNSLAEKLGEARWLLSADRSGKSGAQQSWQELRREGELFHEGPEQRGTLRISPNRNGPQACPMRGQRGRS